MYQWCDECGEPLDAGSMRYGTCENCRESYWGEDDDYDDDDDFDDYNDLNLEYWGGDVPDVFDQKVRPRRRRFLKWAHVRKTSFWKRMRWTWLAGQLQLERQERLAG